MFRTIGPLKDLSGLTWTGTQGNCLGRESVGTGNILKCRPKIRRRGFIWISMARWRMPEVWLNGKKVGGRPFGYSSFRVDLTPYVLYGTDNVVAVRLDTEKFGSRWYPGAGIYRHVRLVKTEPVHVAHWGVFVTTPEITDTYATASVHVEIENNRQYAVKGQYTVDIYELDANDNISKRSLRQLSVRCFWMRELL